MMQFWGNPWIGTAFRVVFGAVLLMSGALKVFDLEASRTAILAYRILPVDLASPVAVALPVLEIVLGLLLVAGVWVRWSALLGAALMGVFIVGIASVWARGYSIDCGCFGGGGDVSPDGKEWRYVSEILRDLALAGMGVWLVAWPRTRLALASALTPYSSDESDSQREPEGVAVDG